MNASCTLQETTVEPACPDFGAAMQTGEMPGFQQPQGSGRYSSEELAQKVLKLTGSVRLASRSAHHWHHCGINE